ncbi:hypothetical protein [Flavobacterium sp.]|uniref:hypothetical protein n=1 Tax=Flavobacterium sp. TaxID=239 RepID=UPI002FDA57BA
MKNYTPLFVVTAIFSVSCFAQGNDDVFTNVPFENTLVMSDKLNDNEFTVVSYHVEEKINMNFGSSTSTYTVPDLKLVNTNDLGPNNSRVVTPKLVRTKVAVMGTEAPAPVKVIGNAPIKPIKMDTIVPKMGNRSVRINVLNTYERVLNNGYKTEDMLKKVADRSFFDDDWAAAAEWYCQLFEITTDLDPVYFYRYAKSLKAVGDTERATEMMALFDAKTAKK